MSERRKYAVEKRRRAAARRIVMMTTLTAILVIGCTMAFGGIFSSAHGNRAKEPVNFKYYKSVQIEEGDTLWSLAEKYKTDDYETAKEYMKELVKLNDLNSQTSKMLKDGDYLLVAYNDTEFR